MLKSKIVEVENLRISQTKKMFSIMSKYYANISEVNFYNDLLNKAEVALFCDENREIRGFTTLAIFLHDDHTQHLFSVDTIIEKEYWGSNDLSHAWINNALSHAERFYGRTFWLLLTKGYKTYKFLPTFFNEFYPRFDTETPIEMQKIMDEFAINQFGDKYKNGVFIEGKDFLKDEFADISKTNLKDDNVLFFLKKNPDYKKGDELICLCELSVNNLNKLGRRVLGK